MALENGAPRELESVLIDRPEAMALAAIKSPALFHRLRAAGKIGPEPIRLSRSLRYDRAEWIAWLKARCPDAATWRAMQAAEGPRLRVNIG
jgi:predicted DNA-binding transcriptional regulator AlpA